VVLTGRTIRINPDKIRDGDPDRNPDRPQDSPGQTAIQILRIPAERQDEPEGHSTGATQAD
jgi:hypothetical protein